MTTDSGGKLERISRGLRLARIRQHRGLTQSKLATTVGVSRDVIRHIEHGHSRLSLELSKKCASAMYCTIEDLAAEIDAPLPRVTFHAKVYRKAPSERAAE